MFDQTAARYNDRSSFANNAAQDGFNFLFSMFTSAAQNLLEHTPDDSMMALRNLAEVLRKSA
jgi:hypothetical protein